MAAPVVSPVRGCRPDSGERGPSAGKSMSLSHSLAEDVLSRTSSNMLSNATESSRACGRAGVIPPFLWFRARPKPPRSGVLDQATLALVPLNLGGYPTPQDPVQRLVSIDVKSGVEKQLATLDPPPDSILAGRIDRKSTRLNSSHL